MTVSNTTCKTAAAGPLAVDAEVAFLFPIIATSELLVKTRVIATGLETTLTENTNYTVSINGDSGGTVTMVTAVDSASELHIIRVTPLTQSLDLEAGGAFNAEIVEDAFDKVTKQNVENKECLDRTVHVAVTDDAAVSLELPNPAERANKFLSFDASGNVSVIDALDVSEVSISTFGESLIDDINAAAAQITLGISSFMQTLLDDANASAARDTLLVLQNTAYLLSSTPSVDMKTASVKRTLYTVPAGKTAIITMVVVRSPSGSLSGGTNYAFGDTATCNNWKTTINLSTMTATTDAFVIYPSAKITMNAAAAVFGMYITTGATAANTAIIDVFGYLF